MIRTTKMTIKPATATTCTVLCETRDSKGKWELQGVIPVKGTVEQVIAQRIANQTRWGWTFCKASPANVLYFQKAF